MSIQEHEPSPPPKECPFCRSTRIVTSAERIDASSYWRCEGCGQMWNVERLRSFGRHTGPRPW
jgi:transposase-like protein